MDLRLRHIFANDVFRELWEDEYLENGVPFCKACKTARATVLTYDSGDQDIMRNTCKCQQEKIQKQKEEEAKAARLAKFRKNQKLSMIGSRYLDAFFKTATITKNNKVAYEKCKTYAVNAKQMLDNGIGIYLHGDNSSGKTYLAACLCNELIGKGFSCIFTSIPCILAEIQRSYNDNTAMSQAKVVEELSKKQFMFIDDLGKEFIGRETNPGAAKFAEKVLLEIINARYNNNLPTFFSSNYSISQLATVFQLDKAIIERINEMATRVICLEGDDFRNGIRQQKSDIAKNLGI